MLIVTRKMKIKTNILFLTVIFATSLVRPDNTIQVMQELGFLDFLMKLFESEEFSACSLQFFNLQIQKSTHLLEDSKIDRETLVTIAVQNTPNTNGVVISKIRKDVNVSNRTYQQPVKISHSKRCAIVVISIVNQLKLSVIEDEMVRNKISSPTLHPPTVRNRDKYLVLTEQHITYDIENSRFIKSLKYKLILILKPPEDSVTSYLRNYDSIHFQAQIKRLCQYGFCGEKHSHKYLSGLKYTSPEINSLFPDQERNFFGHTLRLSTTTKVPQLLELDIREDAIGQKVFTPKRGLYATVLSELSKRLNFTYIILPSSGGGSTGHALPNGTWVGIVGDTYKGIVDFGFMAAITFQRFPYAEFCAPINFAYLGFVTGPPIKSFTWKAILWPLSPMTWLCTAGVILLASNLMLAIFLDFSMKRKKIFEYFRGIAFLIRILLEQCPDLPKIINSGISFKTFLTFWLMFSLVISTVYRSKMVSLLTFPSYDRIPKDFDELALAKDFRIDFHYFGNVGYAYFKTSTNPSFMKIYSRMDREPNPLACMEKTLKKKSACIIFILTFRELLHRNLSDQYGKSPLKFTRHEGAMFPAGVIHEYKAPLSSNFKSVLVPGMETGLIPFWEQTDLNQVLENKNLWQKINNIEAITWDSGVTDSLLRVRNLQGAFAILILGVMKL